MALRRERIAVQVFEDVLRKVLEEDEDANWKHAKKFEHTDVWRKSEDDSSVHEFKVSVLFFEHFAKHTEGHAGVQILDGNGDIKIS